MSEFYEGPRYGADLPEISSREDAESLALARDWVERHVRGGGGEIARLRRRADEMGLILCPRCGGAGFLFCEHCYGDAMVQQSGAALWPSRDHRAWWLWSHNASKRRYLPWLPAGWPWFWAMETARRWPVNAPDPADCLCEPLPVIEQLYPDRWRETPCGVEEV